MSKGRIVISLVIFAAFLTGGILMADNPQTQVKPIGKIMAKKLPKMADLQVYGIETLKCLCEPNMKRFFDAIVPFTASVNVRNQSGMTINGKVKIRYFSLSRDPGKWHTEYQNFTLNPHESKVVKVWGNTYFDIIRVKGGEKVTFSAEITTPGVVDPKSDNNSVSTNKCTYYMY